MARRAFFLGLFLALALGPGDKFTPGRRVVAEICLRASALTNPVSAGITFGDLPILREIDDDKASSLPAHYVDGAGILTRGEDCVFESIRLLQPGRIQLTLIGQTGVVWNVQSSADLLNWQNIGSVTNANGSAIFLDATNASVQRVYRAIRP